MTIKVRTSTPTKGIRSLLHADDVSTEAFEFDRSGAHDLMNFLRDRLAAAAMLHPYRG